MHYYIVSIYKKGTAPDLYPVAIFKTKKSAINYVDSLGSNETETIPPTVFAKYPPNKVYIKSYIAGRDKKDTYLVSKVETEGETGEILPESESDSELEESRYENPRELSRVSSVRSVSPVRASSSVRSVSPSRGSSRASSSARSVSPSRGYSRTSRMYSEEEPVAYTRAKGKVPGTPVVDGIYIEKEEHRGYHCRVAGGVETGPEADRGGEFAKCPPQLERIRRHLTDLEEAKEGRRERYPNAE